jgi:invasion protein IalB
MNDRIASARPRGRALTAALAAATVALAAFASAPATHAQGKKAAPKAAPAAKQPAQQRPPAPKVQQVKQLIYSPWTKACQKGSETNNKQVCVVHTDGRIETGQPVVVAQILEAPNGQKRLQVIFASTVLVQRGTRVLIDNKEVGQAPYLLCGVRSGCMAYYQVDDALIDKLKKGKTMEVQTFVPRNTILSFPLSLKNFAKAYDGPPIDPKQLETQQRKLQSELQKKAEEARKKLEKQQSAPAKKK